MFKCLSTSLIVSTLLFTAQSQASDFRLLSHTIADGEMLKPAQVFNAFGCHGNNVSPDLSWQGAPKGTRSFAITVYDPSAPSVSGWWHWTLVNIPANVHELKTDAGNVSGQNLPAGAVQGRNDYGSASFGGACPPPGFKSHPYLFTLWALDTPTLPVTAESSGALVGYQLNAHVLAKTELRPVYGTPGKK
ncbi:YbhB/YbcL family Raf kinase inhibitor-like protein [Cedecea sp. MMO-103]|uniref:YbhB/YbcL family Raf kinase inhibitor-like protein n=1 Tax=Cedecea sp. MMO-103 TaxID=3081238 RepID=UPI0030162B25